MTAPRDADAPELAGRSPDPPGLEIGWTPSLFRRRAGRGPGLVAVEGPSGSVSYGDLDRVTDRWASVLSGEGVGPGVLVALTMPRSVEAVAAMLAVMKAGGAFLPIDPDYPTARVAFLLKDSASPVVLSTDSLAPGLPVTGARVLTIREIDRGSDDPGTAPPPEGDPGDPAYAIYTSGSTGRPKAALISHRGIGPLARSQAEAFGIGPGTRVLQFASLGFDASISEILVTLLSGGTVCVSEASGLVPGPALSGTLRRRSIHVATLPPTVLGLLPEGPYPDLRTLVVAGEACPAGLASRWSVGRKFINAYGPTEATVCVSLHVCPGGAQPAPPIGRPLPHVEALVLDEAGDPVPDETPGELAIGGPGLALGYLHRPGLTAERFPPHPTATDPETRVYRTGDRVIRRADGVLEFLGRVDDQVKIRGVRIEPGEVRGAIEAIEGVRAAAVLAEGEGRDRHLAAFVVPGRGSGLSVDRIREDLRDRLPIHLLPPRITLVDRLPTTPHGKLDRAALAGLDPRRVQGTSTAPPRTPPRDAPELEVARAWEELFGREVGVDDDFFALGGDSLSAMDLLARIARRCGEALPIAALLDDPTVAGLASALAERRGPGGWSPLVPIRAEGSRHPLYCVHPGGGNVLCYVELARALGPAQPLFGLQAPGVDEGRAPLTSVEAMADEYLDAIRSARPSGPIRLCGWSFGGVVAFEMARKLAEEGRPVDRLVLLDAGFLYSFAILRGLIPSEQPLVRFLGAKRDAIFPEFRRHAGRSQVVPPGASEALTRRVFEVFMANVEALYAYRPAPYRGGAITLMMAEEPFADRRRDPVDEWRRLCDDLDVVPVPGNHLTMLRPPHVGALADRLGERLRRAPVGGRSHG
ncbi:amino acid adenylation domain-containing protein [Tautonia plasticadhaerens]|uniref:Linear gramicidin synthase subunit D n=1 Tax=Tautonia plasticadhaerens TaxID=2527974 RepID=A0A518GX16_9BACT|nr:amino acid adenylation domain-containing protein [Tautonia plasticadhaerens]QDV33137.1 Linear gramicidin synthase subunit D [Tautonia plasticadhaerens]